MANFRAHSSVARQFPSSDPLHVNTQDVESLLTSLSSGDDSHLFNIKRDEYVVEKSVEELQLEDEDDMLLDVLLLAAQSGDHNILAQVSSLSIPTLSSTDNIHSLRSNFDDLRKTHASCGSAISSLKNRLAQRDAAIHVLSKRLDETKQKLNSEREKFRRDRELWYEERAKMLKTVEEEVRRRTEADNMAHTLRHKALEQEQVVERLEEEVKVSTGTIEKLARAVTAMTQGDEDAGVDTTSVTTMEKNTIADVIEKGDNAGTGIDDKAQHGKMGNSSSATLSVDANATNNNAIVNTNVAAAAAPSPSDATLRKKASPCFRARRGTRATIPASTVSMLRAVLTTLHAHAEEQVREKQRDVSGLSGACFRILAQALESNMGALADRLETHHSRLVASLAGSRNGTLLEPNAIAGAPADTVASDTAAGTRAHTHPQSAIFGLSAAPIPATTAATALTLATSTSTAESTAASTADSSGVNIPISALTLSSHASHPAPARSPAASHLSLATAPAPASTLALHSSSPSAPPHAGPPSHTTTTRIALPFPSLTALLPTAATTAVSFATDAAAPSTTVFSPASPFHSAARTHLAPSSPLALPQARRPSYSHARLVPAPAASPVHMLRPRPSLASPLASPVFTHAPLSPLFSHRARGFSFASPSLQPRLTSPTASLAPSDAADSTYSDGYAHSTQTQPHSLSTQALPSHSTGRTFTFAAAAPAPFRKQSTPFLSLTGLPHTSPRHTAAGAAAYIDTNTDIHAGDSLCMSDVTDANSKIPLQRNDAPELSRNENSDPDFRLSGNSLSPRPHSSFSLGPAMIYHQDTSPSAMPVPPVPAPAPRLLPVSSLEPVALSSPVGAPHTHTCAHAHMQLPTQTGADVNTKAHDVVNPDVVHTDNAHFVESVVMNTVSAPPLPLSSPYPVTECPPPSSPSISTSDLVGTHTPSLVSPRTRAHALDVCAPYTPSHTSRHAHAQTHALASRTVTADALTASHTAPTNSSLNPRTVRQYRQSLPRRVSAGNVSLSGPPLSLRAQHKRQVSVCDGAGLDRDMVHMIVEGAEDAEGVDIGDTDEGTASLETPRHTTRPYCTLEPAMDAAAHDGMLTTRSHPGPDTMSPLVGCDAPTPRLTSRGLVSGSAASVKSAGAAAGRTEGPRRTYDLHVDVASVASTEFCTTATTSDGGAPAISYADEGGPAVPSAGVAVASDDRGEGVGEDTHVGAVRGHAGVRGEHGVSLAMRQDPPLPTHENTHADALAPATITTAGHPSTIAGVVADTQRQHTYSADPASALHRAIAAATHTTTATTIAIPSLDAAGVLGGSSTGAGTETSPGPALLLSYFTALYASLCTEALTVAPTHVRRVWAQMLPDRASLFSLSVRARVPFYMYHVWIRQQLHLHLDAALRRCEE